MFFFGDPEDIAQSYITEAMSERGPEIREADLEDMTAEQVGFALVYVRMAFERAKEYDDAPRDVLDAILEIHDELFCHCAARNPEFVRRFRNGGHVFLEHSRENVEKYTKLINLYASSAD